MAYIKYKEITKYFYFSRVLDKEIVPNHVKDYLFDDEEMLVVYKTMSDHGMFTDKKMVLFDLRSTLGLTKQIYTIPYHSISSISIVFGKSTASLVMMLNSGYPLELKFKNMSGIDKVRLRLLYSCITQVMDNRPLDKKIVRQLIEDDITFDKKK